MYTWHSIYIYIYIYANVYMTAVLNLYMTILNLYMTVYICVYIYTICIYIYILLCVYTYLTGYNVTCGRGSLYAWLHIYIYVYMCIYVYIYIFARHWCSMHGMGWLRLVGWIKLNVSFAKEPYNSDYVLQKRPTILRSLLIVSTP